MLSVVAHTETTIVGSRTQPAGKIAIFIGPQTRDGFVDVDQGIVEAIKDIRDEFKGVKQFRVVDARADAVIVLSVLSRHIVGEPGTIGVPSGGSTLMVPVHKRAIETRIAVGSYERQITSVDERYDQWKAVAKQVVKDVTAWTDANRAALARPE